MGTCSSEGILKRESKRHNSWKANAFMVKFSSFIWQMTLRKGWNRAIYYLWRRRHTDCKEPWIHKCLPWLHASFSLIGVLRRTCHFFLTSCWLPFLCLFGFWGSMKIITSKKQARQAYFLHTNSESYQDSPQSANKSEQCGLKVSIKILSLLTR